MSAPHDPARFLPHDRLSALLTVLAQHGYRCVGPAEQNGAIVMGGKGGEFQFYIVPGFGVHPGVSAMFDCFELKLAERGSRVKLGDKNIGYLKADLLKYAAEGKNRKFLPFLEAIDKHVKKVEAG